MKSIIVLCLLTFSTKGFSQISKDEWLIGGNALFSYSDSKYLRLTSIQLNPATGYFFRNKLAGGLRLGFNFDAYKWKTDRYQNRSFSAAPFLRYYFLPREQDINFFLDGAFGYTWDKYKRTTVPATHKYSYHNISMMAGPAVFLNKRTALELILGYTYLSRGPIDTSTTNKLQLGVGLQIHFGRK
jgi:hypothetical protein